jgi:hypothetical protein
MVIRARVALLALALAVPLGAAPAAAWTTQQGGGTVLVQQQDQGWNIELRCQRANPGVLGFTLAAPSAASLAGTRTVSLFATFPNGDIVREDIAVDTQGRVANGSWSVGPRALELFAQGTGLGVGLNGGDNIVLRTDMTGTYAARQAIRSQCGF